MEMQVDANQFALDWRAGYRPALDKILTGEINWVSIDKIHRLILEELLIKYNVLHLSEKEKSDLNLIWHRLRPWDDTIQGLNKLKEKYIICTLSNGNIRLLIEMSKFSNLPWDYIFSAENFHAYKPSPKTYLGVAKLLDVKPNEILMNEIVGKASLDNFFINI
ncbi:2-haloacid dehalogenase [Acinetobacter boissieri]|uniref:2-haloacid dehalogenase n=2 Tax=Acinetobacter boissieri TaxID=1219383 RepID=A0A1G6KDZ6_9GAMM|nr:2-haloacid dehalogenase [Acinetobacter boissieri]